MFQLTGRGKAHTCDGLTRRDFLQAGVLGAAGFSLVDYAALKAKGAVSKDADERSVIMIFNLGAPEPARHVRHEARGPGRIRGPFKQIPTASSAIGLSEILPRHARLADKFSVVRSCYHTAAAVHDTGHQMMQTGRLFTGGINTPHAGCVLSYLRGRRSDLPAHVILPKVMGPTGGNMPHGQDAGFLGKAHDPFVLNADPSQPNFRVPDLCPRELARSAGPPTAAAGDRGTHRRPLRKSQNEQLLESDFEAAFRIMTSKQARGAFELSQEPRAVRDRYGRNRFGQCCLMARRLIEAGVRFVTLNTFLTVFDEITWDIHGSKPFTSIEGMRDIVAPMYDQAYSAPIEDLTIAACSRIHWSATCEFGRTPRVNPAGGRDHWPQCWTVYFAGGGVQGGRVVGTQRRDRRLPGRAGPLRRMKLSRQFSTV